MTINQLFFMILLMDQLFLDDRYLSFFFSIFLLNLDDFYLIVDLDIFFLLIFFVYLNYLYY